MVLLLLSLLLLSSFSSGPDTSLSLVSFQVEKTIMTPQFTDSITEGEIARWEVRE